MVQGLGSDKESVLLHRITTGYGTHNSTATCFWRNFSGLRAENGLEFRVKGLGTPYYGASQIVGNLSGGT